jgi:hypothetical protein
MKQISTSGAIFINLVKCSTKPITEKKNWIPHLNRTTQCPIPQPKINYQFQGQSNDQVPKINARPTFKQAFASPIRGTYPTNITTK